LEYYESRIKSLLNNELIDFVGEIGHDEKSDFLGNAAAFLFPIQWPEPFGIVMIEALACGTPVIAFRRGSVPEVLEDGVTGFIVDDAKGAVDALQCLGKIKRQACRKHFERHFSDERMAAQYLTIYERLIQKEPTAITLDDGVMRWTDLEPNTTT
jgi:glycosyltransferase involved in cell wall biosynthesis